MSQALPREERTALGLAIMALAVVFFTAIDTCAKWLLIAGIAPIQVVFLRYAGHFVTALAFYVPREGLSAFRSAAPWRQALRSLLLMGSTLFNFTALKYLPLTLTTTIAFAAPIVVTLLAIPVLGEKVGRHRIIAVCTGFVGVLVTVQPWDASFHPAVFLSLGALSCASGYFILTRMLAGTEANATSQLWSSGLATMCLAPFGLSVWIGPAGPWPLLVMMAIGVIAALGHIAATHAHRLADASILAPVIYIQLLLAAVASIIAFGAWPTVWTLGGGLIIIASGLYIWHRERARPVTLRAARASPYGPRRPSQKEHE